MQMEGAVARHKDSDIKIMPVSIHRRLSFKTHVKSKKSKVEKIIILHFFLRKTIMVGADTA